MTRILDQNGQPFSQDALAEPQTSRLLHLKRELAGHPARGLTPARLNEILESAEHGDLTAQHELYKDMEQRDGHLFSLLSKRKSAITLLDWDVVPPHNASKAEQDQAVYVKELLTDFTKFEFLMSDALDAIGHGFSAVELEWQRLGGDWVIKTATHRPQGWFRLDIETHSQILLRDKGMGQPLIPFGWVLHKHQAMSGYAATNGLMRVLVWPYLFKHFSVGDLAEFLDIYGLPIRLGKYPANATDDEKGTLWQAVAGIGHNAAGIIPQSMMVEFVEAAKGSEKPFEAMIAWCERTQSKAVLGSTLTSDAGATGLGSGLAEIHNEGRREIRDSDCKKLASTLTEQLIYPLLALNKGVADVRRCPRFVFDTGEAEDIKTFADALPKLVGIGFGVPVKWAHERLKIPLPAEGEAVLAVQAAGLGDTGVGAGAANKAEAGVNKTSPTSQPGGKKTALAQAVLAATSTKTNASNPAPAPYHDQAVLDAALLSMDSGLQSSAEVWLKPALAALRQCKTPEAALNLLSSSNPQTDDKVLAEALARVLFVAELVGLDSGAAELI